MTEISYNVALAQKQSTLPQQNESSTVVQNTTSATTFNVNGMVASWTVNNKNLSGANTSTASSNAVVSIPSIISGLWNLQIVDGKVKAFVANMTMVNGNGSDLHTHSIFNFKPSSVALTKTLSNVTGERHSNSTTNPISNTLKLTPNSSLSIPVIADISTNSKLGWSNVTMTIFIR
jgi:hypothetical protein